MILIPFIPPTKSCIHLTGAQWWGANEEKKKAIFTGRISHGSGGFFRHEGAQKKSGFYTTKDPLLEFFCWTVHEFLGGATFHVFFLPCDLKIWLRKVQLSHPKINNFEARERMARWWQLKYFLCSPRITWGRWTHSWLAHIFQLGWWKTTNQMVWVKNPCFLYLFLLSASPLSGGTFVRWVFG